jgi:hypothetical protein
MAGVPGRPRGWQNRGVRQWRGATFIGFAVTLQRRHAGCTSLGRSTQDSGGRLP